MATDATTLVEMLTSSVEEYPENPLFGQRGIDGEWHWITYAEFGEEIDKARGGLSSLGITKGDRVAIISDNRVEWAVGAHATYSLGAVWVPMYEAQTQSDWVFILRDCAAKVLFAATDGIRAQIEEVADDLPDLTTVIVIDDPSGGEAIDYTDLLARGLQNPTPVASVVSGDLAGLIYTSGTTGDPKGVMLSHDNFMSNINAVSAIFPLEESDRSASFLPWAHSFGQTVELHALTRFGASTGLTSARTLTRDMPEIKPTILVAVPTVFNRVYDGLRKRIEAEGGAKKQLFDAAMANGRKRIELEKVGMRSRGIDLKNEFFDRIVFTKVRDAFGGRLKYAFSGGAAISLDVAEFISAVGITVYEGYGLTETSPIVTCNIKGARRLGSVGRVIPGVTVEIDTDVTGDRESGEIIVHGPNVMLGYYNLPEEDAAVFTHNRGFRTGDLGHVDADGYLFIRGRIKEQYKLENGKYVVPSPIEEQLQLSGYISQVMVHGEQRPHNVAVVVPDVEYLNKWAEAQGLDASDLDVLLDTEMVKDLFQAELDRAQSSIKQYQRVRGFVLQAEGFTPENGMLTPSLKVKRRAVIAKYGDSIDALYSDANPLIGRDE